MPNNRPAPHVRANCRAKDCACHTGGSRATNRADSNFSRCADASSPSMPRMSIATAVIVVAEAMSPQGPLFGVAKPCNMRGIRAMGKTQPGGICSIPCRDSLCGFVNFMSASSCQYRREAERREPRHSTGIAVRGSHRLLQRTALAWRERRNGCRRCLRRCHWPVNCAYRHDLQRSCFGPLYPSLYR